MGAQDFDLTLDDVSQQSFHFPETVESVVHSRENGPLIAAAATLWIEEKDHVLDVTYGRGRFWTHYQPFYFTGHDLALDGVDFRDLPYKDETFDVVVFDPPYIAQGGRETSTEKDFLDRYGLVGGPTNHRDLLELFRGGISEAHRVLRGGGRLFVKCMDYVNGRVYRTGRHDVVSIAFELGFKQVDEFVHYSGTGPQPPIENPGHSRRAHSFLCIFRKPKR